MLLIKLNRGVEGLNIRIVQLKLADTSRTQAGLYITQFGKLPSCRSTIQRLVSVGTWFPNSALIGWIGDKFATFKLFSSKISKQEGSSILLTLRILICIILTSTLGQTFFIDGLIF